MDLVSKHRLIGASIWLLALILIVPSWYNNPVNFNPEGEQELENQSTLPIVDQVYRLPAGVQQPQADKQAQVAVEQVHVPKQLDLSGAKAETASLAVIKPKYVDQISDDSSFKGQWIVRLLTVNNVNEANELADKISVDYPVYIKYFQNQDVYSVRTGPYISRSKADKDRHKLDKMLRTKGEVVQLP